MQEAHGQQEEFLFYDDSIPPTDKIIYYTISLRIASASWRVPFQSGAAPVLLAREPPLVPISSQDVTDVSIPSGTRSTPTESDRLWTYLSMCTVQVLRCM